MATVIIHNHTGKHYILVGVSYSYYKDSRPSFFGGDLFLHEEEGKFELAAVCDEKGTIGWLPMDELTVVEIDSSVPNEILKKYVKEKEEESNIDMNKMDHETCPGCGQTVKPIDKVCPSCGLTLILEDTKE